MAVHAASGKQDHQRGRVPCILLPLTPPPHLFVITLLSCHCYAPLLMGLRYLSHYAASIDHRSLASLSTARSTDTN